MHSVQLKEQFDEDDMKDHRVHEGGLLFDRRNSDLHTCWILRGMKCFFLEAVDDKGEYDDSVEYGTANPPPEDAEWKVGVEKRSVILLWVNQIVIWEQISLFSQYWQERLQSREGEIVEGDEYRDEDLVSRVAIHCLEEDFNYN